MLFGITRSLGKDSPLLNIYSKNYSGLLQEDSRLKKKK